MSVRFRGPSGVGPSGLQPDAQPLPPNLVDHQLASYVVYRQLGPFFYLVFRCSNSKISLLRFNQICRPLCQMLVLLLFHWGGIHCSSFLGQLLKFIRMPWTHILIPMLQLCIASQSVLPTWITICGPVSRLRLNNIVVCYLRWELTMH